MKYHFETSNNLQLMAGTGKLIDLIELNPQYSKNCTELYGKLLTIFGQPAYTTKSVENAYCYVIIAKDENGSCHTLSVYEGSSGPAIGGPKSAYDAAQELKNYIVNSDATPADYEYEGYYFDTSSKIRRGIIGGEVFYSEVEMSAEEFEQAYKEVY